MYYPSPIKLGKWWQFLLRILRETTTIPARMRGVFSSVVLLLANVFPMSPEQSAELMFCFLFWRRSNTPQHARAERRICRRKYA